MLWIVEAFEVSLDVAHLVVVVRITFSFNNIQYLVKYQMKNVFPLPRVPHINMFTNNEYA
jgi:hypothetical protein